MSPPRAKSDSKRYGRQLLLDPLKRKTSATPVRKSARLQKNKGLYQQPEIQEQQFQLPSPTSITVDREVCSKLPGRTTTTTDSGQSIHRNQPTLPTQIESGNGVKSLDRTTNLKPRELLVHLPKPRKGLPENVNESHLQTVLLKAQHAQIFVVTPRITTLTLSSVGSKKEAGLEEISTKTATWLIHLLGRGQLRLSANMNQISAVFP